MAHYPFGLSPAVLPVTVPDTDHVLLGDDRTAIAMVAGRVIPNAFIFQLLVRVKDHEGWRPNITWGLPHLRKPGDMTVSVHAENEAGHLEEVPLEGGAGGGGDGAFEYKLWVEIPPTGKALQLRSEWPERGLAEQTTTIDLEPIRAALQRCRPLWSDE